MGHGCHDCGSPNGCDCTPEDKTRLQAQREAKRAPKPVKGEREGWAVVLFGDRTFFGRSMEEWTTMSPSSLMHRWLTPVYELQEERMPQQLPNGQIEIKKSLAIAPVANLVGINRVNLPDSGGYIFVPLEEIEDQTTRATLFALVGQIEEFIAQQKRIVSGIAVAEQAAKETKFGGGPREG